MRRDEWDPPSHGSHPYIGSASLRPSAREHNSNSPVLGKGGFAVKQLGVLETSKLWWNVPPATLQCTPLRLDLTTMTAGVWS